MSGTGFSARIKPSLTARSASSCRERRTGRGFDTGTRALALPALATVRGIFSWAFTVPVISGLYVRQATAYELWRVRIRVTIWAPSLSP